MPTMRCLPTKLPTMMTEPSNSKGSHGLTRQMEEGSEGDGMSSAAQLVRAIREQAQQIYPVPSFESKDRDQYKVTQEILEIFGISPSTLDAPNVVFPPCKLKSALDIGTVSNGVG
jgi:hypothetical protein